MSHRLGPNKAWHPSHDNQVYVWMPDLKAIKAWWAKNDPNKPAPVAAPAVEAAMVIKKRTQERKMPMKEMLRPIDAPDAPEECPF